MRPASYFQEADIVRYCEFAKNGTVVVFDTETTGFTDDDEVVQLAVVAVRGGELLFQKAVYIKNTVKIDGTEAQQVNGLTDELLAKEGLDSKVVADDFMAFLRKRIGEDGEILLVAHNLSFDWRMIENFLIRNGWDGLPKGIVPCCTRDFVRSLHLPKTVLPGNQLRFCIETFGLDAENSHDALDDACACMKLFKFLTD